MNIFNIVLKPTYKCNMNCPTCSERRNLHKKLEQNDKHLLCLDDWLNILKNIYDNYNCKSLTISGAEPLIYKYIIELINGAYNIGYEKISLNTNGSLLTKTMCNKLFNSHLTYLNTSLTHSNNHNYMIGRGIINPNIFKNVCYNLNYFIKNKPKHIDIGNHSFITKLNLFDINQFFLLLKAIGFQHCSITMLEGNFNNDTYRLNKEDVELYKNNYLNKLPLQYRDKILELINYDKIYKNDYEISNCKIIGNFGIILPNGDVHQCNVLEYSHEQCLNLFDYNLNFNELFESNEMKNLIAIKSNYCNRCPMKKEVNFNLC